MRQVKLIMLEHPASPRGPNTLPLPLRALAGAAVCPPAIMSRASPTAHKATNPQSRHHSVNLQRKGDQKIYI